MEIYTTAAAVLSKLIEEVWKDEESMVKWFKEKVFIDLDRTTRAKMFVTKLVDEALVAAGMNSGSILPNDRKRVAAVLSTILKDFNLVTQIALNLQTGSLSFDLDKMQEDLKPIESSYPSLEESPLAKKAKYKPGVEESEKKYNLDLALIKNAKIVGEMQRGTSSYRISPLGKTPALADINNLSNLSPLAIQSYLDGELFMFDTSLVCNKAGVAEEGNGKWTSSRLKWPIQSESGGDIVKKALASRYIVSRLIFDPAILHLVPRYESVIILRDAKSDALDELIHEGLVTKYVRT